MRITDFLILFAGIISVMAIIGLVTVLQMFSSPGPTLVP